MVRNRGTGTLWVVLTTLSVLVLAAALLVLLPDDASAVTISSDTTYSGKSLEWAEDVEVTNGAKLSIRSCDVTFTPPGTTPIRLLVSSGSLEILDSDLVGGGAGFVIKTHGRTVIRNVTATGLAAIANSSLGSIGLPLAAHGGIMAYGTTLTVSNLDVTGAPATALYAEDCDLDVRSLGVHDACTGYTTAGTCAAVALVWTGSPGAGTSARRAVLNASKVQTSNNIGLLIAASGTDLDPTVELQSVELSSGVFDALYVVERGNHGMLTVVGDTNELNHNKGNGITWKRTSTSGDASMRISSSRIYNNGGAGLSVDCTSSGGAADLTLEGCTIEENAGHGAVVASSGCTQTLNVTLEGCTVTQPKGSGAHFTTNGDASTSYYQLRLIDTTVVSPTSHGVYARLSQAYAQLNVTLDGSTVSRAGGDGVHVEYDLMYFTYAAAPAAMGNLTVKDSLIENSAGYAVYDSRVLKSYYQWATGRSTLTAYVNLLGSRFANHTRTCVLITNPSQHQYPSYASEVVVGGCTFTNSTGGGLHDRVDSLTPSAGGTTTTAWYLWGSTFEDLGGTGFNVELRRADLSSITLGVKGCDFRRLKGSGLYFAATGQAFQGDTWASFVDCTFEDLKAYAIYLSPGKPGGLADTHELELRGILARNTTGVYASLDGIAQLDDYVLVVDDFTALDTRGDALKVLAHPYQTAEMVTSVERFHANRTNGTALHIQLTSDRSGNLWGDLTGDDIYMEGQVRGLIIQDHTGVLSNLSILGSEELDLQKTDLCVPGDRTGILELHVATLDRRKASVAGAGSLWVYNSLGVRVEWQNGMAALGAGVQVLDRTFAVVAVGRVDSEAGMPPIELLGYIMDKSEYRSRSPFIVNITFLDLEQTAVCALDEPVVVLIKLFDRVPPSAVILEPDDGSAQRATFFELRGSAFDAHAGILDIRYRLDEGEFTSIGATSPFSTTVEGLEPGSHVLEVEIEDRAGNVAREVIHVDIDNQPPVLIISEPAGDVLVRSSPITVMGETEDGATVSINGVNITTVHGLFITLVHLEEGLNTVTVVSMDRLSNVATVRFQAMLDTVEPFLDVQSHSDGDWVDEADQVLGGIVEAGCTLTVAGTSVEVDNQSFEAPVHLVEGPNLFELVATDPAGNSVKVAITLRLAIREPWVNIESPVEGALYDHREVRVLGTVQEGCTVLVNGRPATIKLGLVDELLVLPEGVSTITVEARDPAGNANVITRTVEVDSVPPVLTLDALPSSTRASVMNVTGSTVGATALWLDGEEVPIGDNGTFWVLVTLREGTNAIRLRAEDGARHEATAEAEVVLDTVAPFLRVLAPSLERMDDGRYVCRERMLALQVVSEPGAKVTAGGAYIILGSEGATSFDVRLSADGTTTVEVMAEDELGNVATVRYEVVYEGARASAVGSLGSGELLLVALNVALVVAIVALAVRYRSVAARAATARRNGNGRRPPNGNGRNGHAPNGTHQNGHGGVGGGGPA